MSTTETMTQSEEDLELITEPRPVRLIDRLGIYFASNCSGGDEICNSDCGSGDGSDAC